MEEYKIKVIKRNRILLAILIFAVSFPLCLHIGANLEHYFFKIFTPILILAAISVLLFYFSTGNLIITLEARKLTFQWLRKPIFNFENYESILLDDIIKVVVDQGILSKIKTKDLTFEIGGINTDYLKTDSKDSLRLLKVIKLETGINPVESWDLWKERGWLTIAFRINLFLLTVNVGILMVSICFRGFENRIIWFLPFILSQLIIGHFQMKSKLK